MATQNTTGTKIPTPAEAARKKSTAVPSQPSPEETNAEITISTDGVEETVTVVDDNTSGETEKIKFLEKATAFLKKNKKTIGASIGAVAAIAAAALVKYAMTATQENVSEEPVENDENPVDETCEV